MEIPQTFITKTEKTFQYDEGLPSLPLHPLHQTLSRYLESVRPFVNDDEFRQTQFVVQQFGSGVGKQLQAKLMLKFKHARNWLQVMWDDKAYLEPRTPIAPHVNLVTPIPLFFSIWPPEEGTQIKRGALVVWCQLQLWKMLRKQQLAVDKAGAGKIPWTMEQYKHVFNCCRIPGVFKDEVHYHFKLEEEGPCPSHVLVICRGRLFACDVLDGNQEPLTALEIEKQFQYINDYCAQRPPGPGLGALTADNRTNWAKMRQHIIKLHPDHKCTLDLLESSLNAVVLDEASPASYSELSWQGLVGDCLNRWFDKSFTTLIFKNGTMAVNCDHTPFEGMVIIAMNFMTTEIVEKARGKWQGSSDIRPLREPRELVFHLDNIIYKAIDASLANFLQFGNNIEVKSSIFEGFGRNFMRSYKLHVDTFVQLALQLNYYKMYRKPAPTYETSSIRRYYRGRTETHRSCTVEAIDWAKSMLNQDDLPVRRVRLFKIAHDKHIQLMMDAQNLKGCDRHLMGLYYMAEELGMEVPQLFKDPAYRKSGGGGNYILSTSYVGTTRIHGGVAPMCPHGYGCFYSTQPKTLTFFISAWLDDEDTSAEDFGNQLTSTLSGMRDMLELTKSSLL